MGQAHAICEGCLILLVLSNDGGDGVLSATCCRLGHHTCRSDATSLSAGDADVPCSVHAKRRMERVSVSSRWGRSVVEPKLGAGRHRLRYPGFFTHRWSSRLPSTAIPSYP